MEFLDLKDIAEKRMELVNPISAEKLLHLGRVIGLQPGQQVIDFGCGYGEMLRLWGESYGINGLGIDVRALACERARNKFSRIGWQDRFEIVQGNAATYAYTPHAYQVAACIGSTFIWGDFRGAIRGMQDALVPGGALAIGEVYWRTGHAPPAYVRQEQLFTETELLAIAREEGFEVGYVVRASQDDWDNYEAENWRGLLDWLEKNPEHPERAQVHTFLSESQDEYFRYGREYVGWAVYLLRRP